MKQLLSLFIALLSMVAVSGQKLPPNSKIIYFGDSQTSFSYSGNGNAVQYQNFGYVSWVMALSPAVTMPKGGILAVPGETTSQMVTRLSGITAFNAKMMVVLAGTNDPLYAIDSLTTTRNLRRVYDAGLAAGMRVFAVTILPRFAQNTYSADVERRRHWINNWIKSQADVTIVNAEDGLNDAMYFEDGLHTSPAGAYALGKLVANEINKLVEPCLPSSASASQLAVASNSNPLMSGNGGRTSLASGTVATNWQLAGNFASTASVVGSKEADENGREKQVITVSGNYTGNTRRVSFNNYAAAPIALSAGQVVEGIAEIDIPAALTNIKAVYLKIQAYGPEYASTLADGNSMFPTSNRPFVMEPGRYVLRTPPVTIDPGTVGQLTTQIVIEFNSTTTTDPVSMVMKVSSIGIRQLPLTDGPLVSITPSGTQMLCAGDTLTLQANTGSGYSYEWRRNGGDLADSTRAAFVATTPGEYAVQVSTTGCAVLSQPTVLTSTGCVVNAITTNTVAASLCAGETTQVQFNASGTFGADNYFTAQLSDASGSFANPVVIGTLPGTTSGTISATIPANVQTGTGFRIRVVSSNPAVTGSQNDQNITIKTRTVATIDPADSALIFPAASVTLTAFPQGTSFYQWLRNGEPITDGGTALTYTTSAEGSYQVIVTLEGGCVDTSAATVVRHRQCAAFQVSINHVADTVVIVNASGGIGAYRYAIDERPFQTNNRFSLLPGRDYVVTVRDSVGCTEQLAFSLREPADFTTQVGTGNRNTTLSTQKLGTEGGTVVLLYDMLSRPDQMDIYYDGQLTASTDSFVNGKGWLFFNYAPQSGSPTTCNLRVYAPRDGAEWAYKTLPPLSSYWTMQNAHDTISDAVFVSPNFPNPYPANTVLVQTFSPSSAGAKLKVDFEALLLNTGSLAVYDGADTTATLLGQYSGLYGWQNIPSVVATNPAGQLTFRFISGSTASRFGWIARVYSQSAINNFAPRTATSGDTIVITGQGFINVNGVRFGGVNAASYQALSNTIIKAVVAAGATGNVEVVAAGKPVVADGFTYYHQLVLCPGSTQQLVANASGATYQWQLSTDSVQYSNVENNEIFSGARSATLQLQQVSSSMYGYRLRCLVDGTAGNIYNLRFENTWTGSTGAAWETASNWSCGAVPDENMDVVIPANAVVEVSADTGIRSLRLKQDATLSIKPGVKLRVKK